MIIFTSALLVMFLGLTFAVYRPPFNRDQVLPLVLRGLALISLALIIGGARLNLAWLGRPNPEVAVLFDGSRSMDDTSKARTLSELRPKLDALLARHSAAFFSFADSLRPDRPGQAHSRDQTNLAAALSSVLSRKPGAVLLVSDGQVNSGDDPRAAIRQGKIPVFSLGVGRPLRADLALTGAMTQPSFVGETTRVTVRYTSYGFAERHAALRLTGGGGIGVETQMPLASTWAENEVELRLLPREAGVLQCRAVADRLPLDSNPANNALPFALEVKEHRERVSYLSNNPTPTSQFLALWLAGRPALELSKLIAFAPDKMQVVSGDRARPGQLALDKTDVCILDNYDSAQDPGLEQRLAGWVRAGGGLLVLGGEGFQAGRELSSVLPLPGASAVRRDEFRVRLTADGLSQPIFFSGGENLFADLPSFQTAVETGAPAPGATVWAEDENHRPLVAFARVGKGRVVQVSFFPLWRGWFIPYGLGETSNAFSRFFSGLVSFLAHGTEDLLVIETDRRVYRAGEAIEVNVWAREIDGRPRTGADLALVVKPGTDRPELVEIEDGRYRTRLDALPPGDYELKARIAGTDLVVRTTLTVSPISQEDFDAGLNDGLLRDLARATGGQYFPADSLPAQLQVTVEPVRRVWTFHPQSDLWFYLAFVGLFSAELFVRKRRGMP